MKKKILPIVSVVMGSDSDLPIMQEAIDMLDSFGIPYELYLTSAHRAPERTASFAQSAAGRGIRIIIAGAGAAAQLAGVIASHTTLPVIGVPIDATSLKGLDPSCHRTDAGRHTGSHNGHRQDRGKKRCADGCQDSGASGQLNR
jgi:phosphoribosylaminoimidazole carboxylase PurE protein